MTRKVGYWMTWVWAERAQVVAFIAWVWAMNRCGTWKWLWSFLRWYCNNLWINWQNHVESLLRWSVPCTLQPSGMCFCIWHSVFWYVGCDILEEPASRNSLSTMMMEQGSSPEMYVDTHQTTWCHIPGDSHLHSDCHANLKSQSLHYHCVSRLHLVSEGWGKLVHKVINVQMVY